MDAVLMSETAIDANSPIESSAPAGEELGIAPRQAELGGFDFEATIDRFQTPLLRYAAAALGRRLTEAEDVVQETFMRLHRQVTQHGQASIGDMSVWLYRVAHNVAMDFGRRRSVRDRTKKGVAEDAAASDGPLPPQSTPPLTSLLQSEAHAAAMSELEKLPDLLKQTVLLKIIEGMTMKQIADVMNTTASNVHYRLHQALTTLAARLKDHDPN